MLIWDKKYETGHPQIDADHQALVNALNKLESALSDGRGSTAVKDLLAALERYATVHFAREEKCMHELRCPAAASNVAAHQSFMTTFAKARDYLSRDTATSLMAIRIHRELSDWVSSHILKIDSQLRACLKGAAV